MAFDGRTPELRIQSEAQGSEGSMAARWTAAWHMSEQLAQRFGASLARARRVAPIFEPKVHGLTFAMWHAVALRAATPAFRIYVNPLAKVGSHDHQRRPPGRAYHPDRCTVSQVRGRARG